MKNESIRKNAGYNLLELIFAIFILGIGLGISARVIEVSMSEDVRARARMEAAAMATALEARARAEGYAALPIEETVLGKAGGTRFMARCVPAGPAENTPGLGKIDISVEWQKGRYQDTYRYRSLIRLEHE